MTTLGPSPMDRAVATRHVRPPGAMLARSDAAHPAVTRLYPEQGGQSGGETTPLPVARSCSSDREGVFLCASNHRSRVTRGFG